MGVPRVVVIGGGFGGLEVCRRLVRANKRGAIELTLVDKENFFQFNPLLPEVATGAVETRHIVYPLRSFCIPRKIRFFRNKVRAVDPVAKVLTLHNDLTLPYDHLVIAADANTRRELLTFVVVGGGITGVEVCSQLMTLFRTTMKRLYPNVPQTLVTVHLIEATERILPGIKENHAEVALGHLRGLGVNLALSRKVVEVTQATVRLDDGAVIPAHTLVWTTGVRGTQLETPWPWPTGRGGRLKVDRTGRVTDGVWALGDIAEMFESDGKLVPQVAQGAIQEGRLVAENLLATLAGTPVRDLKYVDLGYFVGLGKHSTVASLMGIPVAGWLAWYLWALMYMFKVVGLRKQLEVATDMLKTFFVEHDTSQVHERRRILRSQDLEPDLSGQKGQLRLSGPTPVTTATATAVDAPPGDRGGAREGGCDVGSGAGALRPRVRGFPTPATPPGRGGQTSTLITQIGCT